MGGIFEADADNISKAAELIKSGKLVACGSMEKVKGDQSLETVFLELEAEDA